jgi:hypothetical protein
METATIISKVAASIRTTETVEALADKVIEISGPLHREAYLALLSEWKAQYSAAVARIRKAKIDRKGDSGGWHQSRREAGRRDARELMAVRAALKELARRHHQLKRAAA